MTHGGGEKQTALQKVGRERQPRLSRLAARRGRKGHTRQNTTDVYTCCSAATAAAAAVAVAVAA